MLHIKSLNGACYISTITGIEADLAVGDGGLNNFAFHKSDYGVMESFFDYRDAMRNQTELTVDLTKFIGYIRIYKNKTRQLRDK